VDFYLSTLRLDGKAREEPWGYRVNLSDGFMLALIRGDPLPLEVADTVHFGCALPDPEEVHRLREHFRRVGTPEVAWEDSEGYVGVKVRDPDGYVVELAYDVE
jgi:hypothetical protein